MGELSQRSGNKKLKTKETSARTLTLKDQMLKNMAEKSAGGVKMMPANKSTRALGYKPSVAAIGVKKAAISNLK